MKSPCHVESEFSVPLREADAACDSVISDAGARTEKPSFDGFFIPLCESRSSGDGMAVLGCADVNNPLTSANFSAEKCLSRE